MRPRGWPEQALSRTSVAISPPNRPFLNPGLRANRFPHFGIVALVHGGPSEACGIAGGGVELALAAFRTPYLGGFNVRLLYGVLRLILHPYHHACGAGMAAVCVPGHMVRASACPEAVLVPDFVFLVRGSGLCVCVSGRSQIDAPVQSRLSAARLSVSLSQTSPESWAGRCIGCASSPRSKWWPCNYMPNLPHKPVEIHAVRWAGGTTDFTAGVTHSRQNSTRYRYIPKPVMELLGYPPRLTFLIRDGRVAVEGAGK